MFISTNKAVTILGISLSTFYRWEKLGMIFYHHRTRGGHRRFLTSDILNFHHKIEAKPRKTIAYARVSSHDQKDDLKRQIDVLILEKDKYTNFEIISDLGSGINFNKSGLKSLIKLICSFEVDTLLLTHKDRLLRFGGVHKFKKSRRINHKKRK